MRTYKVGRGYIIGKPPLVDPCLQCIIKVTCSELCNERALWVIDNPRKKDSRIKLKRREKRENKK